MQTNLTKGTVLLALGVLLSSSCSKKTETPEPPVSNKLSLRTASNATFGNILTDSKGRTLYFFSVDANGNSGCTGGCEVAWPVFLAEDATVATGINASDIGTITRADGKKQTTFKGWPLYYFASDVNPADIKGDGSGGNWFVAKPDYSIMLASAQLVGEDTKNYLENATVGNGITQYLTDAAGRTLYAYAPDKFNKNNYTNADLSNNATWPIYESDILGIPSVLAKTDFLQITSVGKKQLTFKGRPLYYFGRDTKRGDNKGVSVPAPGIWPILTKSTVALNP